MKERISEPQAETLRRVEINTQNYRASAGRSLAEIDRMNREIMEYLAPRLRLLGSTYRVAAGEEGMYFEPGNQGEFR